MDTKQQACLDLLHKSHIVIDVLNRPQSIPEVVTSVNRNTGVMVVTLMATGYIILVLFEMNYKIPMNIHGDLHRNVHEHRNTDFKILWYHIPALIEDYKDRKRCGFKTCKYANCHITFNRKEATESHVVIFDGRFIPKRLPFSRPTGQIWIFAEDESPLVYWVGGNWWYKNPNHIFNWTMTYNKDNTDIHLPYGEILKHKHTIKRDFRAIAHKKNKTALMIASHCKTHANRQGYVNRLQKYVDVDVFGKCGKSGRKWNCGHQYVHDHCFDIMNNYKFFLAFENAFCHQYFTEKIYENFNYDTIMVTRGGSRGEAKNIFPAGTFISTDDFKSIKDLGMFLKNISHDDYVKLLERKSQFYSTEYRAAYQKALCDICERVNHADKYRKEYKDMKKWAFESKPCNTQIHHIKS